jgi:hypothetical protein
MFGHDMRELPVGASTSIEVERGRGLRARWKWLEGDARAARVKNAFAQGVLRAASVGFRALAWEPREAGRGVRFTAWELLEWSLVPVPANQEAVRVLRSLDLWRGDDDQVVLELTDEDGADAVVVELVDDGDDVLIEVDDELYRAAKAASARAQAAARGSRMNAAELCGLVGEPSAHHRERLYEVDGRELVASIAAELVGGLRDVIRSAARDEFDRIRGRVR